MQSRWEELSSDLFLLIGEFLVEKIVDEQFKSEYETTHDAKNQLKTVALVCNDWYHIVQKNYMEQSLIFCFGSSNGTSLESLKTSFDKFKNILLLRGKKITYLELHWHIRKNQNKWEAQLFQYVQQWKELFSLCPSLEVLNFRSFFVPMLVLLALIRMACVNCRASLTTLLFPVNPPWTGNNLNMMPRLVEEAEQYFSIMSHAFMKITKAGQNPKGVIKRLALYRQSIDPSILNAISEAYGESLQELQGFGLVKFTAFEYLGVQKQKNRAAWKKFCEKCTRLESFEWESNEYTDFSYYETFGAYPKPCLKSLVIYYNMGKEALKWIRFGDGVPMRLPLAVLYQQGLLEDEPDDEEYRDVNNWIPRHPPVRVFHLQNSTYLILKACPLMEKLQLSCSCMDLALLNDAFLKQIALQCPRLKELTIDRGWNIYPDAEEEDRANALICNMTEEGLIEFVHSLPELTNFSVEIPIEGLTWNFYSHMLLTSTYRQAYIKLNISLHEESWLQDNLPQLLEKVIQLAKKDVLGSFCINWSMEDQRPFSSELCHLIHNEWRIQVASFYQKNPSYLLKLEHGSFDKGLLIFSGRKIS